MPVDDPPMRTTENSGLLSNASNDASSRSYLSTRNTFFGLVVIILAVGLFMAVVAPSSTNVADDAADAALAAAAASVVLSMDPDNGLIVKAMIDGETESSLTFTYYRSNGEGHTLAREVHYLGVPLSITLVRFAPFTEYIIEVRSNPDTILLEERVTTGSSGLAELDQRGWILNVTSSEVHDEFGVMMCDRAYDYIYAFDSLGDVVYRNTLCTGSTAKRSWWADEQAQDRGWDGRIVCIGVDPPFVMPLLGGIENGHLRSTSMDGSDVEAESEMMCTHEIMPSLNEDRPIVTIVYDPPGNTYGPGDYTTERIVEWAVSGDEEPVVVIDLQDYLDAEVDFGDLSSEDSWLHTNAVSAGIDNNYLISIRHLSLILSIDASTYELQWRWSSELESTIEFAEPEMKFYNQHYLRQLDTGNYLFFDNGNIRPEAEGGVYSRAVEYEIDFSVSPPVATLVWEWKTGDYPFGDPYSLHGGAVTRLGNGNTIVGAPCDNSADACSSKVYEITPQGEVVFFAVTPVCEDAGGNYRCEAWATINGEYAI